VSNIPILPPTPRNGLLALILSVSAAFGIGVGTGVVQALQRSTPSLIVKCVQPQTYTIGQYNRLKIGMTQTEVEYILQTGIEESRSDGEAKFKWENPDGSSIQAIFQKDRLKHKAQPGMSLSPACRK
jgi:hypothetical protein